MVTVMSFNARFDHNGDGENRWVNRRELLVKTIQKRKPAVLGKCPIQTEATVFFFFSVRNARTAAGSSAVPHAAAQRLPATRRWS